MSATQTALQADWLGACRRATDGLRELFAAAPSTEERARETGTRGCGGDRTLEIDRVAEEIMFAQLAALHDAGHRFTACSEERGEQSFGGGSVRVAVDPIDGSANAKRDAAHYALSVAVADGETMADVAFAFVHDFGAREQWWATRGAGAWRVDAAVPGAERRLDRSLPARTDARGRLELLGIESADPESVSVSVDALGGVARRLRALGAIAVTLCQVAAARYDGMLTLGRSRGVDAAAGQLIVREAGGYVSFPDCPTALGAPLDAGPSSRVVAARSPEALAMLERVGR